MSVLSDIRETVTGRRGDSGPTLQQETNRANAAEIMAEILDESLNILEDNVIDDAGWRRIGFESEREFTRRGLIEMIKISRAYYLSHPLIKRAVDVTTFYTWGQGITEQAKDDKIQNEIVLPTTENDANRAELFGHQARILTDIDQMVEGNVFLVMFTTLQGDVSVRTIPTQQIIEILTREGDGGVITFYRRVWGEVTMNSISGATEQVQREELYPDWRYHPDRKPETIGGIKVNWDAPIMHQRTGGLKSMRFGVPETFAAMDWARAYKNFLEDWHTLVKSLSRFAFKASTKGKKIGKLKEKLEKEGKGDPGEEGEQSPQDRLGRGKRIGDVFVGKEGDDIQAIPKSGATVSSDDARPSRLMVSASMGLPDTILSGDVDVGNFATSKTLDRPTELGMKHRQTLWADQRKDFWRYCIDAKVRAGRLPGKSVRDPRTDLKVIVPSGDTQVDVSFPPILEDDVTANVEAIAAAVTLNGHPDGHIIPPELIAKLMLEALGVEEVEKILKEVEAEREEREQKAEEIENQNPPEPGSEDQQREQEEAKQKVEEALNALTEAVRNAPHT